MIAYLDLHVVVWLAENKTEKLSAPAFDAINESDLLDLLIVAHAKSNNYAPLVTHDEKIRRHYPSAVW